MTAAFLILDVVKCMIHMECLTAICSVKWLYNIIVLPPAKYKILENPSADLSWNIFDHHVTWPGLGSRWRNIYGKRCLSRWASDLRTPAAARYTWSKLEIWITEDLFLPSFGPTDDVVGETRLEEHQSIVLEIQRHCGLLLDMINMSEGWSIPN